MLPGRDLRGAELHDPLFAIGTHEVEAPAPIGVPAIRLELFLRGRRPHRMQVPHPHGQELFGLVPEQLPRSGIRQQETPIAVGHQHGVEASFEQLAEAFLAGAQGIFGCFARRDVLHHADEVVGPASGVAHQ